jgi:hypothetical protein
MFKVTVCKAETFPTKEEEEINFHQLSFVIEERNDHLRINLRKDLGKIIVIFTKIKIVNNPGASNKITTRGEVWTYKKNRSSDNCSVYKYTHYLEMNSEIYLQSIINRQQLNSVDQNSQVELQNKTIFIEKGEKAGIVIGDIIYVVEML